MTCAQARLFFLDRIRDRLAQQGTPLHGFELKYWEVLAAVEGKGVDELWKDKDRQAELEALDRKFEEALHQAINNDLSVNPAARDTYLRALDDIKSAEGVQLQAIVFAAATKFDALTPPYAWPIRAAIIGGMLVLLGLGIWLGRLLHK